MIYDKKVLVVDDDEMIHWMADMFLTKAGYEILKADSGPECLSYLRQHHVDLILMDVEMPGLNGIETLRQIREEHLAEGTPAFFLSGSKETEAETVKGLTPADGFIRKPFMPSELLEAVCKASS